MPVSKLLKFPIGSYLMVRLDYVIICGDELEAKILRLIEMYMDDERKGIYRDMLNDPKNELTPDMVVEITKDVWVAISHRLFMNDLYGMVKSENTLKRAIKSLTDRELIRMKSGTHKYEAPRYQMDTERVQAELDKLARLGKVEYQKLIPSKIDTIKNLPHQTLTPSGYQKLTPSSDLRVSEIDPHSIRDYGNNDTVEESTYDASANATASAHAPALSLSDLEANSGFEMAATLEDIRLAKAIAHHHNMPHHVINCQQWRVLSGGLDAFTCQDYQAAIDALSSLAETPQIAKGAEDDGQRLTQQTPPVLSNDGAASAPPQSVPRASSVASEQTSLSMPPIVSGPRSAEGPAPPAVVSPKQPSSRTPRQRGKGPEKPQSVPNAPALAFVLTEAQASFWKLWCGVWFNEITPRLNETAYEHVAKLAPLIKTAEDLDSLIKRARKDLEDKQGIKNKAVHLGNLVNSHPGWKQSQRKAEYPPKQEEDDPELLAKIKAAEARLSARRQKENATCSI